MYACSHTKLAILIVGGRQGEIKIDDNDAGASQGERRGVYPGEEGARPSVCTHTLPSLARHSPFCGTKPHGGGETKTLGYAPRKFLSSEMDKKRCPVAPLDEKD